MLLNVEELQINYRKLDKEIHDFWKENYFSKGKYSGYGGDIYNLIKPKNYDDFYVRQQDFALKNKDMPISKRGLLYNEIEDLALKLKNFCEKQNNELNFDLKSYIDYIVYINYIQTFNGKESEQKIVNWILNHGIDAELTNHKFDVEYGIDILFDDNKGIQVKSYYFLISNKVSVLRDIKELKYKYKKSINDGIETYYVFFDKGVGKYLSFKNDKILTDYKTLENILNMNIGERKKFLSKIKRIDLP
jgi:hypothetical protein